MTSSGSDSARLEQIVTEFFAKSLHIILESRCPYRSSRDFSGEQAFSSPSSSSSSSSCVRPRDKWFNLALQDCPEAVENLDIWRQGNLEPMIVDVVLVERTMNWDPVNFTPVAELSKDLYTNCRDFNRDDLGSRGTKEKIVERWVVQYEVKKSKGYPKGAKRSTSNVLSAFYKKSILLLRSLYATVRLLPVYKVFHDLNLSSRIQSFTLAHRVSSFVEPFTRREEADMQRFGFTPVDTSSGRLCVSVMYQSSISDVCSKPSTAMSPQLIQDYVGSPLADPLKRFPSLPVAHSSPSWSPFSRRHSWSHDQYRASPPYVSCSPSPTHSEACTLTSNPTTSRFPQPGLPPQPSDPSQVEKASSGKDESRRLSGMGLPRLSFSKSSSRPLDNDFNEVEHTCPFDVGGDDATSPGSRTESFDPKRRIREPLEPGGYLQVRKSTGAAVGALVDLLKKAPPLREDLSITVSASQTSKSYVLSGSFPKPRPTGPERSVRNFTPPSFTSSTVLASRTTADAMEDLRAYKEMKNVMLSQDARSRIRTTLLVNKPASKFAR